MITITSHATASHRYYMNKRKSDIIHRIRCMEAALRAFPGVGFPQDVADMLEVPDRLLEILSREQLASYAMKMHDLFPPENKEDI
jgi:hypothetical protein